MFDEKTQQQLKYYVYMLIDPINNAPFYVGKGKDNRVFAHLKCALEHETVSDKYDKIREITSKNATVQHVIVRHGLSEKEAYEIEATLIDVFVYLKYEFENQQGGHKSIEKGLMTSDEVKRLYNAEPLTALSSDCIIININSLYRRGYGDNAIYNATKGIWTIAQWRLKGLKYVLSEYRGLIVEVFQVDRWLEAERGFSSKAKQHGQTKTGYYFEGNVAPDDVRNRYINKSIMYVKKKGAANAVRYNL